MKFNPSEPRPYARRGVTQAGRWEIDLRGVLDNGLIVKRERRVFPARPSAGKIGKRQALAMAWEEWERWNKVGQVLRPGEKPVLAQTRLMGSGHAPTIAQFAPDYLEICASVNAGPHGANAPGTLQSKEQALRNHLLPAFGHLRMDELHRRDVDRYIIEKTKQGRAAATIRCDLRYLRRMLAIAASYEIIEKVPPFRIPSAKGREIKALEVAEIPEFRAASAELFELQPQVLLDLYLLAGLRSGEALGLFPSDFDLTASSPTVRVARSWGRDGYGPTKGRNTRLVPLVPELAAATDELLSQLGISPRSTTEHPFSLLADRTQPVRAGLVNKWVQRVAKHAQIQRVHPHMLRHTFGTECARRGVPVPTIQNWMGHAAISTTMVYVHLVAPDHLRWASLLTD